MPVISAPSSVIRRATRASNNEKRSMNGGGEPLIHQISIQRVLYIAGSYSTGSIKGEEGCSGRA